MTRYLLAVTAMLAAPAYAQTPPDPHHDHMTHQTAPQTASADPPPPVPAPSAPTSSAPTPMPDMSHPPDQPMDHSMHDMMAGMDHDMAGMDHDMAGMNHGDHGMTGLFGAYPMTRDASGTSWQPDAAEHGGIHATAGDWMLMGHVLLNGVYSSQEGPRGDDKAYLAGMVMGEARRTFANGDGLTFRAMLSPDPLMGKRGYPLLLASGETADGSTHLVDRQHPHDLVMELSASFTRRLTDADSVFVYGGLPGEPAFGPPAFMHRPAAQDSPEAPISHHWLDSTHITFGVATLGWVHDGFKLEASRFRGREPDQNRWDIETGDLDSTAVRASWNPSANWALQASWADVHSPEQLEPEIDETRLSASALYSARHEGLGDVSATFAFGRKERSDGVDLDAWLGEASLKPTDAWTVFARGEAIESDELGVGHEIEKAQKLSLGVIHDWQVAEHVKFGVGALAAHNFVSDALDPLYGGDPWGGMAFVRLKIE